MDVRGLVNFVMEDNRLIRSATERVSDIGAGTEHALGGGNGFASSSLPPGARMFFKISNGMRPNPLSPATSALVSVVPRYKT